MGGRYYQREGESEESAWTQGEIFWALVAGHLLQEEVWKGFGGIQGWDLPVWTLPWWGGNTSWWHIHTKVWALREMDRAGELSDKPEGWCRHRIRPTFPSCPPLAHVPSVCGMPSSPHAPDHSLSLQSQSDVFSGQASHQHAQVCNSSATPWHLCTYALQPSPHSIILSLVIQCKPHCEPLKQDESSEFNQCLRLISIYWQNTWCNEWVNSLTPVVPRLNSSTYFWHRPPHWEVARHSKHFWMRGDCCLYAFWPLFVHNLYLSLWDLPRCHSDKPRGYRDSQFSPLPSVQSIKYPGQSGKTEATGLKEPTTAPGLSNLEGQSWQKPMVFSFIFLDAHQWKQSWVKVVPARKGIVLCT